MVDVEKEIKDITDQIVAKYDPEKIILFGSAARGNFTPDSDLDLLIIKKNTPLYGIDRMRELRRMIKKRSRRTFSFTVRKRSNRA